MGSGDPLAALVEQLVRLPGIGERTATRLAYWLLRAPDGLVEELAEALLALKRGVVECERCCNLTTRSPCDICADPERDGGLICVVERPQDVAAIERGGSFRGRYHVLHGAIDPLAGVGPEQLRVRELLDRIEREPVREVVIATDPDVEGDSTALYLAGLLKPLGLRVTRIAHGLAVGMEVEYADGQSLARALEDRREL